MRSFVLLVVLLSFHPSELPSLSTRVHHAFRDGVSASYEGTKKEERETLTLTIALTLTLRTKRTTTNVAANAVKSNRADFDTRTL